KPLWLLTSKISTYQLGLRGVIKGFIRELFSLLVWLVAVILAYFFTLDLADFLKQWIETPEVAFWSAFIAIILITWFVGRVVLLMALLLHKNEGLSFVNRMLGFVFGLLKCTLVLSLVVGLLNANIKVHKLDAWQNSRLVPCYLNVVSWMETTKAKLDDAISRKKTEKSKDKNRRTIEDISAIGPSA
ncbi:MAG: CvpA family protein, partial [Francisellaceae bacterium]